MGRHAARLAQRAVLELLKPPMGRMVFVIQTGITTASAHLRGIYRLKTELRRIRATLERLQTKHAVRRAHRVGPALLRIRLDLTVFDTQMADMIAGVRFLGIFRLKTGLRWNRANQGLL